MNDLSRSPATPRLYSDLAWLFPIITPPHDYVEECDLYERLLRRHAKSPLVTVLNLGCGAGHHDHGLRRHFAVTGVDLSPSMIALARKLNPDLEYHVGDMRTLQLGRAFDAVTVFDSITYMTSCADIRAVFHTAACHLKPGGEFLAVLDVTRETFVQNRTCCSTHRRDGVDVTFIENYYDPDPADTKMEHTLVFLVRRHGQLSIESDRHVCGLFPLQTWTDELAAAGFTVRTEAFTPSGFDGGTYPVLIGVKTP